MTNLLDRIYDWASKIVCWVDFILISSSKMRNCISAIDDRISHTLIKARHVNFHPYAVICVFSSHKLVPKGLILLNCLVATLALNTLHSLLSHLKYVGVVHVGCPVVDKSFSMCHDLSEVV